MGVKVLKTFISNVESALHSLHMSKSELARKLEVTPQSVGRYLSGEHAPGIDKVAEIAAALGLTAAELLATPEERAAIRPPRWQDGATPEMVKSLSERLARLDAKAHRPQAQMNPLLRDRVLADLDAVPAAVGETFAEMLAIARRLLEEGSAPADVLKRFASGD